MSSAVRLRHVRVSLALQRLREGDGPALLILHGLGERSPASVPEWATGWPGSINGLDFTGHGDSEVPAGGGYTSEVLMGDVDTALAHLGPATVVGRGLGAYVALLIAGARPELVRGAVLADGPGLAGGGPAPGSPYVGSPAAAGDRTPDPFALLELSRDLRPPDYATSFARQAISLSDLADPITVAALVRPDWLAAVAAEPGVQEATVTEALGHYARL
ncbi:MAG TPA: alpha/beta hydrolase [Acidimicrobiales bacterium]|nr:alpha/beta hydrolase [Acidimicrobiales bacterium]